MPLTRLPPDPKPDCPYTINVNGGVFGCVKKKGTHQLHRVEGPIAVESSRLAGFVVVIERSIEWTEATR